MPWLKNLGMVGALWEKFVATSERAKRTQGDKLRETGRQHLTAHESRGQRENEGAGVE